MFARSLLIVLVTLAARARAEEPKPIRPQAEEIAAALKDVGDRYGPDVSLLGAALLAEAIQSGAVDETAISIVGVVEHETKRYVQLRLETGIVYNDREISSDQQVQELWKIVETCLHRFKSFKVTEDGLSFQLTYKHQPMQAPVDVYRELRNGGATLEVADVYLQRSEIERIITAPSSTPPVSPPQPAIFLNGQQLHTANTH